MRLQKKGARVIMLKGVPGVGTEYAVIDPSVIEIVGAV